METHLVDFNHYNHERLFSCLRRNIKKLSAVMLISSPRTLTEAIINANLAQVSDARRSTRILPASMTELRKTNIQQEE